MKQIVAVLGISLLAASCSTTTGQKEKDAVVEAQQRTIDSMKIEMVKQQVIDSMTQAAMAAEVPAAPEVTTVVVKPAKKKKATVQYANYEPVAEQSTESYNGYSQPAEPVAATPPIVYQEPQPVPAKPEKKGWSAKAKGAVIGAAAGAIGGAVINKKQRAVGAVVGGILGAGAGTGIGAVIDKKQGR